MKHIYRYQKLASFLEARTIWDRRTGVQSKPLNFGRKFETGQVAIKEKRQKKVRFFLPLGSTDIVNFY